MREILFRGKRTDNSDWVYGSLVAIDDKYSHGDTNMFSRLHIVEMQKMSMKYFSKGCGVLIDNSIIQIYEETAGQYTGLTDKNGVKIFEGDMLEYSEEEYEYMPRAKVVFDNGTFYAVGNDGVEYRINDLDKDTTVEVVGNVHDNKGLIK